MIKFNFSNYLESLYPGNIAKNMTSYTIGGVPLITYGFIGITAAILGSVHILDKDEPSNNNTVPSSTPSTSSTLSTFFTSNNKEDDSSSYEEDEEDDEEPKPEAEEPKPEAEEPKSEAELFLAMMLQ